MFVDANYAESAEYEMFWSNLRSGTFDRAEYRRLGKGGKEVWIQASYNPVCDGKGRVTRVVKIASDVTAQKLAAADAKGQLAAISKAQAVIEFSPDGIILTANQNFCSTLGYALSEIQGQHHRMFVQPTLAASPEYAAFWDRLQKGEHEAAEYLRLGKGGREIWIQATYNPIFDLNGKVCKVVKFATDITERKRAEQIIGLLKASLGQMAEGNLTGRIDTAFSGQYEELRQAFNHSLSRFTELINRLRATSASLKSATAEILAGANDLAERTTKQAATIEETSAAMEQLAATVGENAKRSEAASGKAHSVSGIALQTGMVMQKSNEAMERISTSSSKISNIIGLIDDIAFQTNLLALNASVEAARAGDAGKGFAVVAVEVRRLAQSAAKASSDVKALIEQSSIEVAGGNKLVAEASQKLNLMLEGVKESAALLEFIAQATQQQSNAISEVSIAVRQMDEMTQHNAALVEETNAAIEQTEGQASELDSLVDVFVMEGTRSRSEGAVRIPAATVEAGPASAKGGVMALQQRVKAATKSYLSKGSAALKSDWSEF